MTRNRKLAEEVLEAITGHTMTNTINIPKDWIYQSMEQFAEQVAKDYRTWCNHQVIAGRTDAKLWEDYQTEKQSNV